MNIKKSLTANPLARETTTDYDKLMTDFLASDKSEEYKRSILSLLNTDYSKFTYDGKEKEEKFTETLNLILNGIEFKTFTYIKVKELARGLGIKNYTKFQKQELIEKIESIKKYFCDKNKE